MADLRPLPAAWLLGSFTRTSDLGSLISELCSQNFRFQHFSLSAFWNVLGP